MHIKCLKFVPSQSSDALLLQRKLVEKKSASFQGEMVNYFKYHQMQNNFGYRSLLFWPCDGEGHYICELDSEACQPSHPLDISLKEYASTLRALGGHHNPINRFITPQLVIKHRRILK